MNMRFREREIENVVVGSGAAGFQAALRLYQNGETDTVIVTENVNAGTSRNTGSDKQTYYKLSLAGEDLDSVCAMAEDLFSGQCVDGDMALCEAALSVRGFYRLAELGVPFPCTEYGEFMGYKTDHDRGRRATSAGPYTSRIMTECLERQAKRNGIEILDQMQAIRILKKDGEVRGLLCLDKSGGDDMPYVILWCKNLILATGGPAGMYHDSVYPTSQIGGSGMAFEAGVKGKNLTEWQFGLASVNPRWNVSGTYMQVLPRFVSTDSEGNDEREFLMDYFENPGKMLSMVFLKGYQWPFDVNKIFGGSSVIDLLVYRETILKGRKVFLDFTKNPGGKEIPFSELSKEAYDYLEKAGALFGTPIERLKKMNEPAIRFYEDHDVKLYEERLEIAICAQHNNGGLSTDCYWETDVRGLFAVGEVCGSHGVTRPGGTALNAGQVGAMRAAEKIHLRKLHEWSSEGEPAAMPVEVAKMSLRAEAESFVSLPENASGNMALNELWLRAARRMSGSGGMIRERGNLRASLEQVENEIKNYQSLMKKPSGEQFPMFYRLRDMLISQRVYLAAMLDYAENGGGSRGSALYTNEIGELPDARLPELYRCLLDNGRNGNVIQEISLTGDSCAITRRPIRPIPQVDYFFENQWRAFREREKIG